MKSYEIEGPWAGQLAIVARPRGGEWLADDLQRMRNEGYDVLVSLLTQSEANEFDLAREAEISNGSGIKFISLPVADLGVPQSVHAFRKLVDDLTAELNSGKKVAIHCRQGIGRSGLLAAALLVSSSVDPDAAIRRVSDARGLPVPETPQQKEWITKFAEDFVDTLAQG